MEPVYKPRRGFVDKNLGFMIVSDASAYLSEELGFATGIFTAEYPFLRPPRLFDIATEQSRALRSRMLMESILDGRLHGAIVRLGRSVPYIDRQANKNRRGLAESAFLGVDAVRMAQKYPTNASQMRPCDYRILLRHGFEAADATLSGHCASEFPTSILWSEVVDRVRCSSELHVLKHRGG
jgi:NTE family protein